MPLGVSSLLTFFAYDLLRRLQTLKVRQNIWLSFPAIIHMWNLVTGCFYSKFPHSLLILQKLFKAIMGPTTLCYEKISVVIKMA